MLKKIRIGSVTASTNGRLMLSLRTSHVLVRWSSKRANMKCQHSIMGTSQGPQHLHRDQYRSSSSSFLFLAAFFCNIVGAYVSFTVTVMMNNETPPMIKTSQLAHLQPRYW